MADRHEVRVDFKAVGNKNLEIALKQLAASQTLLRRGVKAYEAELKRLDQAMAKGTALSDAMKKMNLDPGNIKDYNKFNQLVSEGMIGFPNELKEQIIRAKYGDVVDQKLLNQMLFHLFHQLLYLSF